MGIYRCLAVAGIVAMSTLSAAAQSKPATAKTPWGDPDLQGTWTTWDQTPLEARSADAAQAAADAADSSRRREIGEDAADGNSQVFRYNGKEYKYIGLGSGMGREHNSPVSPRRRALVVDPADGRVPIIPGKTKRENLRALYDDYLNHSAWTRCISMGVPGRLLFGRPNNGYNKAYEIFQAPGQVVIFHEMLHEARIIPLDGRPHTSADIKQWLGDSRGHWEGPTLVVETTNFNGKGDGNPTSVPQTQALHVVERFTRLDDKTMEYKVTLTDPNVYSRPWTGLQIHNLDPKYTIFEYACHEGNWRYMENSLSQGRILDAEEAAKKAGSR